MADDVFRQLGLPRLINAAGTLTRLGGVRLPAEIVAAMVSAAGGFARIDELQAAASRAIAEHTGAEAGLVTSGAAAGLTLAAAAAICGDDFGRMDRLPHTEMIAAEIIIPRSHRNGYDHALRAAGARLVEVGVEERSRDPQPWEIAAAIGPETAAVSFFAGFSQLSLESLVEVAHAHDLPVIVDASATLPPRRNLKAFIAAGADLVVYSGGKGLRGPQSSGILCGRRDLIASAALQMWDLDFLPELWNPPESLIDADIVRRGVPNHGLGRGLKVGKEEIAGLLAALDRFARIDEAAEAARLAALSRRIVAELPAARGVRASLVERPELWPTVLIEVDPQAAKCSAVELARKLEAGDPAIYLQVGEARTGRLRIDPFNLLDEEVQRLVAAISQHTA